MFAEDLNVFFDDVDGFAVNAVINTGTPRTIRVIYDTPLKGGDHQLFHDLYYTSVKPPAMSDVNEESPQALVKASDITGATVNTPITIEGVDYFIVQIHPDGTGLAVLILSLDEA